MKQLLSQPEQLDQMRDEEGRKEQMARVNAYRGGASPRERRRNANVVSTMRVSGGERGCAVCVRRGGWAHSKNWGLAARACRRGDGGPAKGAGPRGEGDVLE